MENPSSQPEYFKFNDTPPEAPKRWFQRPEVLKRIGIIVGVTLLLVGIAIFANNLIGNMNAGPKSELEATQTEIAQRQADCAADDKVCKTRAQTEVARASGIAAACEGLENDSMENCMTLIALERKDSAACGSLLAEAQATCVDAVLLARVADGEGMALCDDVTDSSKKASCQDLVTASARSSGECGKYGVSEEVCESVDTIQQLLLTANLSGCIELTEESRVECMERFTVFDGDGDGLSVGREIELGTSDTNADTDGDGYSDGEEVLAGYNPLN